MHTCNTLLNGFTEPYGDVVLSETKKLKPFSLSASLILNIKVQTKDLSVIVYF